MEALNLVDVLVDDRGRLIIVILVLIKLGELLVLLLLFNATILILI